MKRLALTLLALGVLVVAVCVPAMAWNLNFPSEEEPEPTRIVGYAATYDVATDGSMAVREDITVQFPSYPTRHGIFRFFDRADDNAPRLRRDPQGIAVWKDGAGEPFSLLEESQGRYVVAKIGSAYATVSPGLHTYQIRYSIDDVLLPQGDASRFYWNLIPGGWRQRIDKAKLTVHLPATAGEVRCAVGTGEVGGCKVRGEGTSTLVVRVLDLAPGTPVTVSATVAQEIAEPEVDRLWSARFDPVLGSSLPGLVVVLLLAGLTGLVGLLLVGRSLERKPGYPLMYAPPEGVGPAQAQYVLTEQIDRRAFVATVMDMAEQGAVDLKQDASGWTITPKEGGVERLGGVTASTAKILGLHSGTFRATPKSAGDGKRLKSAIDGFERAIRNWAREERLITSSGLGTVGRVMVLVAAAVAAALIVFNPIGMTAIALIPGAFAACALGLLFPGASTRRTSRGRDLWSRAGGFRRVLSTPSSEQRFEFSGRGNLYTAYVPWAVAFGVADEWAAKYRTEMGVEPPVPAYFAGAYAGDHTSNFVSQMVSDFDHTVSSAISSYEATQRSSSSGGGGGGFSGGGGGGGGGGGSW